eukprot:TRINITY_DN2255_c0_g1_i1.p1 TRINITY_DN2255_c0_g1~~TRINITY_DN2255_c0_g1_i1.p1  ORF type:complete len:143 (+),score=31.27 TRINITY_DN2255_c0_g1_i1:122-550(+)
MTSVLLSLLLASLFAFTAADIWTNCGTNSDHIHIKTVKIVPDPPVRGQKISVTFNATLDEPVKSGEISLDVKWGFITILKKTLPLCSIIQPYEPCPLAAGVITRTITEDIPSVIPGGHYSIHVIATDQASQELACIQVDVHW